MLSGVPIAIGSISGLALCQKHYFGSKAVRTVQTEYSTSASPYTFNFLQGEASNRTGIKKRGKQLLITNTEHLMFLN